MLHLVKKIEKMSNLIRNTSYSDGNHFDEEEQLYELADEYLSDFYDRNGIEELYEIDDAEY